jgi:hypothetical protein
MRKPTRLQYFFASETPGWIGCVLIILCGVGAGVMAGRAALTYLHPLSSWWNLVRFVLYVGVTSLLGLFLATFPGTFFVGVPLFQWREEVNGAPFKIGDTVQILSERHKGRIGQVYAIWQYGSLRVYLGEHEKEERKDIFSAWQLLREGDAGIEEE